MKVQNEILKILNTYNDEAKINDKQIYEKKKLLYQKEINLTDRVENWRKEIFSLKPYNIHFLNSVFLNENAQFKDIKTIFNKYNQQVSNFGEGHVDIDHLRPMVMDSMLKFMRLVMLTEDRQAQLRLLKASHQWLMEKLDPSEKYDSKHDYTKELDQRLEKVKVNDSNKILSKINENLPSQQIKNERYDFYRRFRTQHPEIEPPADRIKNYKPRILNLEDPDKHKKPAIQVNNRIKYQKITYKKIKKVEEEEKKDPLVIPQNMDAALLLDQQGNPMPPPGGAQQNKVVIPEGEGVVVGEQQLQQPQLGQQPQPDQQEQQVPDEPQEGKLNPRVKNYIYPPRNNDNMALISMQDRFLKSYQKIQRRIIEDRSKVDQAKQWAKKKARLQSEANRKLQSIRQMARLNVSNGQAFSKIPKLNTEQVERTISFLNQEKKNTNDKDFFDFESKINQQCLESTKKFSGKQIHLVNKDKVNPQQGLSLYDRKRIKTEISYQNQKKPFSAILKDYSKQKQRQNSLDEINEIKQRFAKYKINIQMKRIGDGILPPVQIQDQQLQKINKYEADLPNNPFFKVGKKKKKKKKKK